MAIGTGCRVPKCDMDVAVVVFWRAAGGVPNFYASLFNGVHVVYSEGGLLRYARNDREVNSDSQ